MKSSVGLESSCTIAFFSMEVGLEYAMPTYSGGLGVLAGDSLRAAADLGVNMVGVTLLHRKGYFLQHLDATGNQSERPHDWSPERFLQPLDPKTTIVVEGRSVTLRAWRYSVQGVNGHIVPVYFLDTDLPENGPWDRKLSHFLYGGDARYRLCQEVVLGMGGMNMLKALGHKSIKTFHMNEGHSALLTLALLEEQKKDKNISGNMNYDIEAIRKFCVFTTHTPVPAGHDQFPLKLAAQVLGEERTKTLENAGCLFDNSLNMTYLGLFFSRYINGVSMRHEQVSQNIYPHYPINSITNGVHAVKWTSPSFAQIFDSYFPEWRCDNRYLRYAMSIPLDEIQKAHKRAKLELINEVERRTGIKLDPEVMTIGFARRATEYKRADLIFNDLERLKRIAKAVASFQIIYAGKAHPRDEGGKAMIRRVYEAASDLKDIIPVVYLEQYDMELAKYLCAGVDLWLNTPQKPQEASGTSGMKAAMNGVPSLSILDGWWIEGHIEGVTGWSIGDSWEVKGDMRKEEISFYSKLEELILPTFYERSIDFAKIMRSAITLNGSFFNSQRMMSQYMQNAYSVIHKK